jgi:hypothetical protein
VVFGIHTGTDRSRTIEQIVFMNQAKPGTQAFAAETVKDLDRFAARYARP